MISIKDALSKANDVYANDNHGRNDIYQDRFYVYDKYYVFYDDMTCQIGVEKETGKINYQPFGLIPHKDWNSIKRYRVLKNDYDHPIEINEWR